MLGETLRWVVEPVLQSGVCMKRNCDAGKFLNAVEEGWVELNAELGEWEQRGRVVGIVQSEHASSGRGGVDECGIALEDDDVGATGMELQGEGKTDDAGTGDEDVWCRKC